VGANPLMPLHAPGDEHEDDESVGSSMNHKFPGAYEPCLSDNEPKLTLKGLGVSLFSSLRAKSRTLGLLAAVALGALVLGLSLPGRPARQPSTELPVQAMQEMGTRPEMCSAQANAEQMATLRCGCANMAASQAVGCYLAGATELNSNELQSLECKSESEESNECHAAMFHTRKILSFGTRSPGEVGWSRTIDYLSQALSSLGWYVEYDQFTAETPLGNKPMKSVIASFNPHGGDCILDLAAHLDSKYFQDFNFLGATDSAAPMGMMLSLAESLTPLLKRKLAADGSLPCFRMLFFDGEEAFVRWTATDSTYGSRHMAATWSETRGPFQLSYGSTRLSSMRTLMLLDLLGAARPSLTWRYEATMPLFARMQGMERKLRNAGLLKGSGGSDGNVYLSSQGSSSSISDDHLPFLERGVPVLHLIADPFPSVWHTRSDDLSALDPPTVEDLAFILRGFVAEVYALRA